MKLDLSMKKVEKDRGGVESKSMKKEKSGKTKGEVKKRKRRKVDTKTYAMIIKKERNWIEEKESKSKKG